MLPVHYRTEPHRQKVSPGTRRHRLLMPAAAYLHRRAQLRSSVRSKQQASPAFLLRRRQTASLMWTENFENLVKTSHAGNPWCDERDRVNFRLWLRKRPKTCRPACCGLALNMHISCAYRHDQPRALLRPWVCITPCIMPLMRGPGCRAGGVFPALADVKVLTGANHWAVSRLMVTVSRSLGAIPL